MQEFIYFIITFICIYFLYFFLIIKRKGALVKFEKSTEVAYLVKKYKLEIQKIDMKALANIIAFANALVLSVTVFFVLLFENIILKIFVSALIMISLILIMYHAIGLYYKKKEIK